MGSFTLRRVVSGKGVTLRPLESSSLQALQPCLAHAKNHHPLSSATNWTFSYDCLPIKMGNTELASTLRIPFAKILPVLHQGFRTGPIAPPDSVHWSF